MKEDLGVGWGAGIGVVQEETHRMGGCDMYRRALGVVRGWERGVS